MNYMDHDLPILGKFPLNEGFNLVNHKFNK